MLKKTMMNLKMDDIPGSNQFNLNPFLTGITEGISLITAVKNRKESLEEALQTWLTHPEINEIIIVDWDSEQSLSSLVDKYQNGRIILARVVEQPLWILSLAYNLSARLTSRKVILKVDADVKILPGFFKKHILTPGMFYAGNWRTSRDENETHLNGNMFLFRDDFFRVNGYNENIRTYGWDDSDLYERLNKSGLNRLDFDFDTMIHIIHGNRMSNQRSSDYLRNIPDEEWVRQNIFINKYLCLKMDEWNKDREMAEFILQKIGFKLFEFKMNSTPELTIPDTILKEARLAAIAERLDQLGHKIPTEIMTTLTLEEAVNYLHVALNAN